MLSWGGLPPIPFQERQLKLLEVLNWCSVNYLIIKSSNSFANVTWGVFCKFTFPSVRTHSVPATTTPFTCLFITFLSF